MEPHDWIAPATRRLAALYDQPFGGKAGGRFRISAKLMRRLCGRRRLYESDLVALTRALHEAGFVLIDMDTFYVVTSTRTFTNYRRVSEGALA